MNIAYRAIIIVYILFCSTEKILASEDCRDKWSDVRDACQIIDETLWSSCEDISSDNNDLCDEDLSKIRWDQGSRRLLLLINMHICVNIFFGNRKYV